MRARRLEFATDPPDSGTMEPQLAQEIRAEVEPWLADLTSERVLVWGAGELGTWLMDRLGRRGVGFVDGNPAKVGTEIHGRPVLAPGELEQANFDKLVVAVLSDSEAIRDRLEGVGLTEERDFHIAFPSGKRRQVLAALPRTLAFLDRFELAGRSALEVGFGGQLYLALTLLHRGAEHVVVTDVEVQARALLRRRGEWLAFAEDLARATPGRVRDEGAEALLARIELYSEPCVAESLPFEPDRFGLVASTGVLEHVDEPDRALAEFRRVLAPGGLALALAVGIHDHRSNDPRADWTPWSFLRATEEEWRALGRSAYHQNRWRAVDFVRGCESVGLEILARESVTDPRLTAEEVSRFAEPYRSGYTLAELAELDLYLGARRPDAE